jgi:predicted nucleotidyltransferase
MSDTEVWLYGSMARGDTDDSSDVDLLVVGEDEVDFASLDLPARDRLSISRYSWQEIEHMAGYGSLFLHHLKREGKPLLEGDDARLRVLLASLGEYSRTEIELACFARVVDDVECALEGDHSVQFEMSVLGTAARHAAILGCYLMETPDFGRDSAFETLLPQLGYRAEFVNEVIGLYAFRQAENEGRPIAAPPSDDLRMWVSRVRRIIEQVGDLTR